MSNKTQSLSPVPRQEPSTAPATGPTAWIAPDPIEERGQVVIDVEIDTGLAAPQTAILMELIEPASSWDGLFWDCVVLRPGKVQIILTNPGYQRRRPKPVMVRFSPLEKKEMFPGVKFEDFNKVNFL